jgi:DNA-binding transcriptional LysR family regulator
VFAHLTRFRFSLVACPSEGNRDADLGLAGRCDRVACAELPKQNKGHGFAAAVLSLSRKPKTSSPASSAPAAGVPAAAIRRPAVMHVLRDELPKIEVTISSKHSPQLAEGLATGKLDVAFMRSEEGHPDLVYRVLITEPLIVVLPIDHRLASRDTIPPLDFVGETFIGMADQAPRAPGGGLIARNP